MYREPTHFVAYKLNKDSSPMLQGCYSVEEQKDWIKILKADGYKNPSPKTPEEGYQFLEEEQSKLKPTPKTRKELWWDWAMGKAS